MGCYIWYSEEGTGQAAAPPSPLIAVPNVTAHPSTSSVPITVLLHDGQLLCGFNVIIKELNKEHDVKIRDLHGNGKSSHHHPLPQKLYPSPSVPIRHGFRPHPSPQHLTSIPIRYRNTFFNPQKFVLQSPKLIGLVSSSNTST